MSAEPTTNAAPAANILELEDVHTYYGSIHALKGISIEVREGEVVTLLGANGAGKSTTLRSINGLNRPRHQRPPDRAHLLLAPGHRARLLVAPLLQPRKEVEDAIHVLADPGAVVALERAHLEVLRHRHPREQPPAFR